jgi:5-methylcytosine-specific restriction endonuclease McrA
MSRGNSAKPPKDWNVINRKWPNSEYPPDWPAIAERIKAAAGYKCERCGHEHDYDSGHVLTVHHLDGNKFNCADWNLAALCQRCHLVIQGRVKMDQGFFEHLLPVSDWFKPHLEGYLNMKREKVKP